MQSREDKLPNDAYVFRMTDDTGMFQHARCAVPDPSEGYTTDDNARALIMAALLFSKTKKQKYMELAARYLRFLLYAQNGIWFRNFMDYDRRFTEERGSDDCYGRCLWALGFTVSRSDLPAGIRDAAEGLLRQTVSGCEKIAFLRSKAYAIIGLNDWKGDHTREIVTRLASELRAAYEHSAVSGWRWFEDKITYCNAVLPWAMLAAYETTEEKADLEIGLESLRFLLNKTFVGDVFHPVGCWGWYPKEKTPAAFDQQPVEACGTLLACLKAYELTKEDLYWNRAKQCLNWYTGQNSLNKSLIDPDSGGCMDGLISKGLNRNEGAESIVSWMIAWLTYSDKESEENGYKNL